MTNPSKSICERIFSCCYPSPVTQINPIAQQDEKKTIVQIEFFAAIGNTHKRVQSTDVLSEKEFIHWVANDNAINRYVLDRKEKK